GTRWSAWVMCMAVGCERSAAQRGLYHHGATAQRRDHPVANKEAMPGRRPAWRPLADGRALLADLVEELAVSRRVSAVNSASKDGDRCPSRGERAAAGTPVDSVGPAGHDRPSSLGQRDRQFGTHMGAIRGRGPGAHHRHRPKAGVPQIRVATYPQGPGTRITQHVELAGPFGVTGNDQPDAIPPPG